MPRKIITEVQASSQYCINDLAHQMKEKIKEDWRATTASSIRKHLKATGPKETGLTTWFTQQRTLNGPILSEKARQLALELDDKDFKTSNGFTDRFKERHGIIFKTVQGEAGAADVNAAHRWKTSILPTLLQRYSPKDIYNADESASFYECSSSVT